MWRQTWGRSRPVPPPLLLRHHAPRFRSGETGMSSSEDEAREAESLARAAGLTKAWAEHRAAVLEAIAAARKFRDGFVRPADPAAEPMPSYRVPGTQEGAR